MPKPELRPPAGHESADVRVVAPINAGQQGDTSDLRSREIGTWVVLIALLLFFLGNLFVLGHLLGTALLALGQLIGISAAVVLS